MTAKGAELLDTATVVRACQAISRESSTSGLATTLIDLLLQETAATAGFLLLVERGEMPVVAQGKKTGKEVQLQRYLPDFQRLPLSIVDFVRRTGQQVTVGDTSAPHDFSRDEYLSKSAPLSLACTPLVRENMVVGAFYLEGATGDPGFPEGCHAFLQIVAAQAVIALENVRVTERFGGLLESAPDALVIVDDTGAVRMVNSQVERLFGYGREELVGQHMQMLLPERYRERHKEHLARFMEAPQPRSMGEGGELFGRRKDGSEFPVDIALSHFAAGGSLLVTAAVRDVTERKRAETALRVAEAKYRSIFENALEGIFRASTSGVVVDVNPALARMLGFSSPMDLLANAGSLFREIRVTPEAMSAALQTLREKGVLENFEVEISSRRGTLLTALVQVRAVRNGLGEVTHYEGVVENVTERKKAEEALRFSEARYRALYRDNPTMIFTVNAAKTIQMANRFAARRLGYEIEELEGKNLVSFFHDEDQENLAAQIDRCLANPHEVYTWQFRKRCKSGKIIWVEEIGQAVYDLDGSLNVLIVCLDITGRRCAEVALKESELKYRQLSETLELRVRATVDELRQKDKLLIIQSRQAVMGEMISNIAHQWRQPLNTLALLAQEMHYFYKPHKITEEEADANFKKTMATINHMSKTIDDFRNFFRPEKEKTVFRLRDSIQHTLNLIEGTLNSSEIRVEVNTEADPEVEGFPNEFSQVLVNILINARDAFHAGQVENRIVTIDLFEEGGKTVVTITDNAGGMPGWVLEKIFEPYFTTKAPDKGTGVGLFMSKMIIEKSMNGTLSARNVENGAQFRIEL